MRFDRAANVVASDEGEFVYDACEQLVEARHPRYGGIYYEYDGVGNRTIRRAANGETRYSTMTLTAWSGSCVRMAGH